MSSITGIRSLSSGFTPEYMNVQTLELEGPVWDGDAFGDLYNLLAVNGAPPPSPQIVKVLRDNGFDSARKGFETIERLQRKILDDNLDRKAAGSPAIQTLPALRALPQFSFCGQMAGHQVFGYSAGRLDVAGYVPLARILDPDDDPGYRDRYVSELTLNDRLFLALQLTEGVQAVRRLSYVYGDIGPHNLFVNIGKCHVALIHFDSGAVMEGPDDMPLTFGNKTDGEWIAPEIMDQILVHRGGPLVVRVDRSTNDWALTVGIHYLLFLCGPFFHLRRSSSRCIRDYVTRFQWPAFDAEDPLFAPDAKNYHVNYLAMLGEFPAPVMKRMSDALNAGAMEPKRRVAPYQWVVDLGRARQTLKILLFQAEPETTPQGSPVRLTWRVAGSRWVSIDNGIGPVDEAGSCEICPDRSGSYMLTAQAREGDVLTATATVRILPATKQHSAMPPTPSQLRIFISYSHKDQKWIERIRVHLKPLAREYNLDIWDDSGISAGAAWREEIEQAIDTAGAALLLVSADFLASDFVHEFELPRLLVKAKQHGTLILPLIVSACRYTETPWLRDLQGVNDPRKPIDRLPRGEQEQKFLELVLQLERALRKKR